MNEPAVIRILAAVLKAYAEIDDPGMSDLDGEQPVALHVHIKLGDIRRIHSIAFRSLAS